ncbi:helix-turn-helix domain-containing protein [Ferruginibacter sp.]
MSSLKYKVITSKSQYKEYTHMLEALVFTPVKNRDIKDEIALLTLLIETWDEKHNTFNDTDPISLLHSLMNDHQIKAKDLVILLNVSKGYVSDILNYRKGLSKEVIRKLAAHFKLNQEAFNVPYPLVTAGMKTKKRAQVLSY